MRSKTYSIVGLGELLWDVFPNGKKFGGAPANFAYHAKELGAAGYIISAVGEDSYGIEILAHLQSIGLTTEYIAKDPEHRTGIVEVKLDDSGKPDYVIHENVAWDVIPFTSQAEALARSADAVCFGSLAQRSEMSRNTINKILGALKPACLKVFDINLRQNYYNETIIRNSLEQCNCLKLNDDELPVVMDMCSVTGDEGEALGKLIRLYNLRIAALTKGGEGSLLMTPDAASFLEAPEVKIADTVGAGDSFTAALVTGMLKGYSLDSIHQGANRLAAYVCTQNGATPRLPDVIVNEYSD